MEPRKTPREPLHERVAASLRASIREPGPGARLPNDADHARRLGVSVSDALRLLEQEGLGWRRRGAGTLVNTPASKGRVAILCADGSLGLAGRLYGLPALQRPQDGLVALGYTPDVHMEVDGFLGEALRHRVASGKSHRTAAVAKRSPRHHVPEVSVHANGTSAPAASAREQRGRPGVGPVARAMAGLGGHETSGRLAG